MEQVLESINRHKDEINELYYKVVDIRFSQVDDGDFFQFFPLTVALYKLAVLGRN